MSEKLSANPVGVLITGGTVDKIHDSFTESLILDGDSCVPDIFEQGRTRISRFKTLMQIDSLDMVDADREKILNAVETAPENRLVITHGTGTMELTAKFLSDRLGVSENEKVVVLTGAMRPWCVGRSDAGFT